MISTELYEVYIKIQTLMDLPPSTLTPQRRKLWRGTLRVAANGIMATMRTLSTEMTIADLQEGKYVLFNHDKFDTTRVFVFRVSIEQHQHMPREIHFSDVNPEFAVSDLWMGKPFKALLLD